MAYTPELSQKESALVRRIAWALGVPMTKCMTRILETSADLVAPVIICKECKEREAQNCKICMIKETTS